jgi:transposase
MPERRSELDRARVIALFHDGVTIAEIVRRTGFERKFVRRWAGRGSTLENDRSGRPSKVTPPLVHTVRAMMKGKKGRSTRRVSALLKERKNLDISRRLVGKIAKDAGLKPYKRRQKPLLSDDQRARRLAFAHKYRHENFRYWLFTDEKTFELFGHPKNNFVWEESAAAVPGSPKVKHPPKVHVWGGISWYGKTKLYVFTQNLDKELYVKILSTRLPADIPDIFGNRQWTFQQDGDPKHTSRLAQDWLMQNVPRLLPKEDWPANSPDQNVVENFWGIVQDRVYAREPRTVDALKRIIREEWEAIEMKTLRSLVDSMPRRLDAIIAADGGPTKY